MPFESRPHEQGAVSVREMYERMGREWDLELLAGEEGMDRLIETFELNRPGLALAGYFEVFSGERVQLIGLTETHFLDSLTPADRLARIRRTMEFRIPCVIVTRSMPVIPEMETALRELGIPLLRTSHLTTPFQAELGQYLERRLAPRNPVHGVMVEVFGMGALIQGKSGVGKSECALELIQRGHLLVADDVVMLRRVSRGRLFGEPAPNLGYHMEVRGIGIIDIELLFGVRAVREESELSLVVELEKWNPEKEYERLGLVDRYVSMFECFVPHVTLPVEPGRNLAQLVEVAALMQRLRAQGVNVARDFDRRIQDMILRKKAETARPPSAPAPHPSALSSSVIPPGWTGRDAPR